MWCHLLLLAPVWGLVVFAILPLPVAVPVYVGIVALALFLYKKVWHAVHLPPVTGPEALVGQECEAVEDLGLRGLVRCGGVLWTARPTQPVSKGERVRVVKVHGSTLVVAPLSADAGVKPSERPRHGNHAPSRRAGV